MILDTVFNHLGPEGNYSHQYSDYFFYQGKDNPWGQNFNLHGDNSAPVRAMLLHNVRYWLDEFRIDGFRMDATHTIHDPSDVHLLAEAADIVHSRGGFIIAEDDRNTRSVLDPQDKNGWHFDGLWSDDFHHVMRVSQTGDQRYFYCMFKGSADEVVETLQKGWLYTGQVSPFHKEPRGTPADDFPPQCFVYCISNHDQVGNRLVGDRFHQVISPAAYRAVSLFLCLVPETPMLFMGQEWAREHAVPLLHRHAAGAWRGDPQGSPRANSCTPSSPRRRTSTRWPIRRRRRRSCARSSTGASSTSRSTGRLLHLYRAGLKLRRELFGGVNPPRNQWTVRAEEHAVIIRYEIGGRTVRLSSSCGGDGVPAGKILLRSNALEFGGDLDASSRRRWWWRSSGSAEWGATRTAWPMWAPFRRFARERGRWRARR